MLKNFFKKGRCRLSIFFCAALTFGSGWRIVVWSLPFLLPGAVSPASAATKLSLAEAIIRAEAHDYAVSAARHDSAAAAGAFAGARAERFPVLSLEARSFYIDELQKINLLFGSQEIGSKDNYQADLKVAVPLYTGGRLSHRIGIMGANLDAVSQTLAAEKMTSAYRCRQAYLGVLAAQASLRAASSSLERLDLIVRDVRNLFENGLADSIDILEAELARQKGDQQVERQKNAFANAMSILMVLIGIDETEEITLSETIVPPSQLQNLTGSRTDAINRPELARYDHIIRASEQAIGVERGALAPILSGYAGYTYGKPNKDMSGQTWNDNIMVGVTMSWEFNLGGKTFRDIQSAHNRAASARMAKKNLLDALRIHHNTALNNLNLAYRTYQISEKEYQIAVAQFRLAETRQAAGRISINRLLEMEADLTAGEQQFEVSIIQYYQAENEYFYAVGSDRIFGGLQ